VLGHWSFGVPIDNERPAERFRWKAGACPGLLAPKHPLHIVFPRPRLLWSDAWHLILLRASAPARIYLHIYRAVHLYPFISVKFGEKTI
jgi:hypothetical protein